MDLTNNTVEDSYSWMANDIPSSVGPSVRTQQQLNIDMSDGALAIDKR